MGRNRGKKNKQQQQGGGEEQPGAPPLEPEYVQPSDPPRAVLAVHTEKGLLAVAAGPELRVFDSRTGKHYTLVTKPEQPAPAAQQPAHAARGAVPFVRGVAFNADGTRLLAGTEDKSAGMRLWDASTWEQLQAIKVPKKVTNIAFTPDGRTLLAADKFGDVLAAAAERPAGLPEGQQQEPELLLGHFCAILTSLSLSAGGRFLATTDRDHRVRVSVMPANPLEGAHEIQSFGFGHTAFVTCSTFVQHGGQELLVTGSGDGTLRVWEPVDGSLLHTLNVTKAPEAAAADGETAAIAAADEQQGEQEGEDGGSSGDEEGDEAGAAAGVAGGVSDEAVAAGSRESSAPIDAPVPLALAASPDGRWLVAAVDGRDELCLLRMDWSARQLAEVGWHALPGLHLPASLAFDASGRLWAAGGPVADDSAAAFLACGTVAEPGAAADASEQPSLAPAPPPDWLPADAVAPLEAKAGDEAERLAAAAERRRLASQQLQKRRYSLAQLEHRKRRRRDRVQAAAAAAAAAAEGAQ